MALPAAVLGVVAAEMLGGAALSMGCWGGALGEGAGGAISALGSVAGSEGAWERLLAVDDEVASAAVGRAAGCAGTNTTSPIREEDSHGVCFPSVSATTPVRTCLKICSIFRPGTVMACRRCLV